MTIEQVASISRLLQQDLNHVIAGKPEATRSAVLVLLCEGHLLIEDVPGVGKTTLAKTLARAIGGTFSRVQFTPDLLPTDITGSSIYNQVEQSFEFRTGPVFANVLLADEINRSTPKTQSALLEAMEERTVSAEGVARSLPRPFMVVATQNNVEMAGTFPLPEAQMDRFFGRISLGYPDRQAEKQMLLDQRVGRPLESVRAQLTLDELLAAQAAVREVHVEDRVQEYIVDVARASREHSFVALGASPRAALHLQHAAQAHAAMEQRDFVTPDDVKAIARLVLAHRLIPRGDTRSRSHAADEIVEQLLSSVPAPVPTR